MDLGNAWLKRRAESWMILAGLAGVLLVDLLDYLTPTDVRFAIVYLVPVMASAWFGGLRAGIIVALAAAISRLLLEVFIYPALPHAWAPYLNLIVLSSAFSVVAVLASSMRYLLERSEERVIQRTSELQKEISERKRVEVELRASEQCFRQLTDNIKGVFWMTNVEKSEMIYISPGYETIWGRSCQSLYDSPQSWVEAIDLEDRARVAAAAMNQRDGLYDEQYRIIRPDGSCRWIRDRGFPVYDSNGKVYRIAGIADDITVEREAEAAVAEKEERFRLFMDNHSLIAFIKDEAGRYQYVNSTLQKFFSFPLLGKTSFDLFPAEVARRLQENDRLVLESGQTLEFTDSVAFPDGRVRDWINYRFPFRDSSGGVFVGCLSVEITKQRRLERQLLEISDREQARIGHDLHDELCQFLVGILFHCQDLCDDLRRARRPESAAADQIADLINSAITQARQLARGLFPVLLEREGLVPALQEFALGIKGRFKTECSVQCDNPVSIEQKFVANHLYRITQEAVNNAARHARAQRITIHVGTSDSNLELAITDDGVGMNNNGGQKHGMGLHIMNYRAHSIGGTLEIKSRHEQGTSIVCRVPLDKIKAGS